MDLLKKKNNIDQWLVVLGIFAHRLEVIFLLITLFILINRHRTILLSRKILICFLLIFITSFISITLLNYDFSFFFKQYSVILFYCIVYSFFFQSNKYDLVNIFSKYIKICYLVSILGLVQFVVYVISQINIFSFINKASSLSGTQLSRISSFTSEPSNLAVLLVPAIAYYLFSDTKSSKTLINYKKRYFLIILVVAILTFSSIFYFSLFLMLLFKVIFLRKNKLVKKSLIVMFFFSVTLILNNPSKQIDYSDYGIFKNNIAKIDQALENVNKLDYESIDGLSISVFATLVNLSVAVKSPNRISGTGLGTHEQNYESIYPLSSGYVAKNTKDAYSLATRVFSEFGIIGLILLITFFVKYFNKHSFINMGVLFLLISLSLRGGNFVLYGVIFFFFLYYHTRLKTTNNKL